LKERAIQAFEGLMKTRGGPAATQVIAVLRRAGNTFSAIVTNPKGFLTNLVNALQTGFKQFSSKIVNHLKNGLAAWLTGSLSATGLSVPDKLDARGIVSLALSVLGINYGRVRNILVKRIGGGKVKQLEGGFDLVQRLANGGLAAAVQHMMHVIVGLGNVGQKVREIIGRVQARVDVAVNKLVDLVAKQGNDWLAKAGGGRPSNAAGGSGRPGSQRPVPPNRTGQPRTPVTQNPRSGQPRTPATRNPAPATSPRPATRNPSTGHHRQVPQPGILHPRHRRGPQPGILRPNHHQLPQPGILQPGHRQINKHQRLH
jgi:hypothetical protein